MCEDRGVTQRTMKRNAMRLKRIAIGLAAILAGGSFGLAARAVSSRWAEPELVSGGSPIKCSLIFQDGEEKRVSDELRSVPNSLLRRMPFPSEESAREFVGKNNKALVYALAAVGRNLLPRVKGLSACMGFDDKPRRQLKVTMEWHMRALDAQIVASNFRAKSVDAEEDARAVRCVQKVFADPLAVKADLPPGAALQYDGIAPVLLRIRL
jgi:hypothetical protein